ncbi:hypothetical protein BJY00DRAFT_312653 [Aspergillus carlsbadensis]|nr:hypothetical protein BJY00DRAFT_312653 [Aspergillus carlsbadensis]
MESATRVILRLSVEEFPDWTDADTVEVLKSFFAYLGRSEEELEGKRHYWRTEPPYQETARPLLRFHIILDLEKAGFEGPINESLKHEIYRVQRKPSISIKTYVNETERENLIQKIRIFTDRFYPWGSTRTSSSRD